MDVRTAPQTEYHVDTDTSAPRKTAPGTDREDPGDQEAPLIPSDKTPEEFFEEMMQREDVRGILEELARGEAWRR